MIVALWDRARLAEDSGVRGLRRLGRDHARPQRPLAGRGRRRARGGQRRRRDHRPRARRDVLGRLLRGLHRPGRTPLGVAHNPRWRSRTTARSSCRLTRRLASGRGARDRTRRPTGHGVLVRAAPASRRDGEADGAFVGRLSAFAWWIRPRRASRSAAATRPIRLPRGRVYNGGPGLRRGLRVRVRSVRHGATCGLPRIRGRLYGLLQ